jgi:hypothetical protein
LKPKEEKSMSDNDESGISGLGWFLAGLGLGALAGVLYAPKAGKETREELVASALDARDRAAVLAQQAQDKAAEFAAQGKQQVSEYGLSMSRRARGWFRSSRIRLLLQLMRVRMPMPARRASTVRRTD